MKKQLLLYAAVASTLMFSASIYSITTPGDNKKAIGKLQEEIEQIKKQIALEQPTLKEFTRFKNSYNKVKKSANNVLNLYASVNFEKMKEEEYNFTNTIASMQVFSMVSDIRQDIHHLKQRQDDLMEKFSQNPEYKELMERWKKEIKTLGKKIKSAQKTLFSIIEKAFKAKKLK